MCLKDRDKITKESATILFVPHYSALSLLIHSDPGQSPKESSTPVPDSLELGRKVSQRNGAPLVNNGRQAWCAHRDQDMPT